MKHSVIIKDLAVQMEVKNKGVEFEVRMDEAHQGDCVISKTGIEWCQGKTKAGNGVKVSWTDFIDWINEQDK